MCGNMSIQWSFNNHHLALILVSWPCLRNPYQPRDTTPCLPRSTFFVSMSGLLTPISWWHREMETFSALEALCEGNLPVIGGSLHKGPVMRTVDVSSMFDQTNCWTNTLVAGDLRRRDAQVAQCNTQHTMPLKTQKMASRVTLYRPVSSSETIQKNMYEK